MQNLLRMKKLKTIILLMMVALLPMPALAAEEGGEGEAINIPEIKGIEYNGYDLNTTLGIILQTLSDVSQKKYYGTMILIDVVRGSQNKRVLSDGLNTCKGYGKLSGAKHEDVQFLVEWLIENEFIRQTRGPYPVLHPTYKGEHYSEVITRQKLQALKRKLKNTETHQDSGE